MSMGRLAKRFHSPRPPHPPDHDVGLTINQRLRTSRSHESLLLTSPASMHCIDVSGADVEIKPLHSSLLGQEHCFQVSTAHGSKYYSCRSAEERQHWIRHLRKTVQPKQEMTQRTDNSLKLWVLEAKNVPAKKRYFCELCLDDTLYARTSTKPRCDMLFWGEHFDFHNLPSVEKVTVNIYREADRKKKKEKNLLLGSVDINVSDISQRHLSERWYTATPVGGSGRSGKEGRGSGGEMPMIRIKARYQTVRILPLDHYARLVKYIEKDYSILVEVLEPLISVKAKEELATCLVNVLHKNGQARDFLSDIVMAEVDKLENDNLAFRGNSIATKAMEAYLKLVGEKYLHDTLSDFIRTMLDASEDCEVDPARVGASLSTLARHQNDLKMYCGMAWFKIINSQCFFPRELKEIFASLREQCDERKRADVADNLISACIFLRFLCPAVLSPSLFGLTQEFPQERSARNLTLIAKVIQSLANFTKFGAKEEFMGFLNEFVESEMISMKNFLKHISTVDPHPEHPTIEFDGFIDQGRELSVLHSVLTESLNPAVHAKLSSLHEILDDITHALSQPSPPPVSQLTQPITRIYDNIVTTPNCVPMPAGGVSTAANGIPPQMVTTPQVINTPPTPLRTTNVTVISPSVTSSLTSSSSTSSSSTSTTPYSRTFCGFDNPHRNRTLRNTRHATDDHIVLTSVENSPPDHLTLANDAVTAADDRLAASHTSSLRRPDEKIINQSWEKMLNAADMVNGSNSGEYVDLISFVDDGDQASTVASSGYQSFGYSQSSSPIEHDTSSSSSSQPPPQQQALSFANPLFGQLASSSNSVSGATGSRRRHNHSHSSSSLSDIDGRVAGSSSSDESLASSLTPRTTRNVTHANKAVTPGTNDVASTSKNVTVVSDVTGDMKCVTRGVTDVSACRPSGNTVRMGVRSVQRKLKEQDTPKVEYEQELSTLRQQLAETQRMLSDMNTRLEDDPPPPQPQPQPCKPPLQQGEMKQIITRLISTENNLRREQTAMSEKQDIINAQERQIESLNAANHRLLLALHQLKDRYTSSSAPASPRPPALPANGHVTSSAKVVLDNGQFRSSNC